MMELVATNKQHAVKINAAVHLQIYIFCKSSPIGSSISTKTNTSHITNTKKREKYLKSTPYWTIH